MKIFKTVLITIFLILSTGANAALVKWELANFQFDDGGTAYGSFLYNTNTYQLSDIDIYTTSGSKLSGRHFIATAGVWGSTPDSGVLAFTDTASSNYIGAGYFRINANINFNPQPGDIVTQWLAVGKESFCVNSDCSSAANEITNPGESRDTISGHLVALSSVPLPATVWLFGSGLIGLVGVARHKKV